MGSCNSKKARPVRFQVRSQLKEVNEEEITILKKSLNDFKALNAPVLVLHTNVKYLRRRQGSINSEKSLITDTGN